MRAERGAAGAGAAAARDRLLDREPERLSRLRQHEDVVRPDLEDALDEAGRRRVGEHEHREVGILLDRALEQVEDAVGVAGAGDDEDVALGAPERPGGRVEALDHADDVDLGIVRERRVDPVGLDAAVDRDEGADSPGHASAPPRGARCCPVRPEPMPSLSRISSPIPVLPAFSQIAPSRYRRFRRLVHP